MPEKNEKNALEAFYEKYSQKFYGAAYALLQDPADAEDAVSEVFLWLCEHSGRFEEIPDEKKPAYAKTALRNICLNMLKKRRKYINSELFEEIPDLRLSVEETALGKERRDELVSFINSMSEALRKALYLKICLNFTTAETAEALGISETAARKRLSDAGKQIKKFLEVNK